ncbi:MAG: E2/UBC family protein [Candidatus Omnitrophota bacterium]
MIEKGAHAPFSRKGTMRNLKRLALEMKILQARYGADNVDFPSDGTWVRIRNYSLPPQYNLRMCPIVIIIPEQYDTTSVTEVYTPSNLRIIIKGSFKQLENWHDASIGKHSNLFSNTENYMWICFHPGRHFVSLLDFLNTLRVYFTNPFLYKKGV